ncbi:MAG: hypothetical protein MGU50_10175 [Trichodesmium sp. MAG_R02]|nr:hypothetical protein [Trichodesmium sp. MAG_R02]
MRELISVEFPYTADAKKAASRLLKKSKYQQLTDLKITKVNNSKTAKSIDQVKHQLLWKYLREQLKYPSIKMKQILT